MNSNDNPPKSEYSLFKIENNDKNEFVYNSDASAVVTHVLATGDYQLLVKQWHQSGIYGEYPIYTYPRLAKDVEQEFWCSIALLKTKQNEKRRGTNAPASGIDDTQ